MRAAIPAEAYLDEAVFQDEQERLFRRGWTLAGFAHDLAAPQDYVVAEVGGHSVVVQRFPAGLRAYRNVCPHRSSRIRLEPKGHGVLQCPYHGWTFNAEGVPVGIPQRSIRCAPGFDPEALRLEAWEVGVCGTLVFVRRGAEGPSLRDALGEAHDALATWSEAFGVLMDVNRMTIRANWKVVVENTLDDQHVDFVHPSTFGRLKLQVGSYRATGPHSTMEAEYAGRARQVLARLHQVFADRPVEISGYVHHYVFPNLTLATSFGTSFSLQVIRPLGPAETEFTSYVFLTRHGEADPAAVDHVAGAVTAFNREVFEEDRVICEAVQAGLRETRSSGIVSPDQDRVLGFHRAYMEQMDAVGMTASAS